MNTCDVILLSFANQETRYLRHLKDELKGAYKKLYQLKEKDIVDLVSIESITADEVHDNFLEQYKDRIVIYHYGGHAAGDALLLDDRPVFAQGLAGFLGRQEGLQLVFLNACNTLQPVASYLKAGVKALLATTLPVEDGRACLFAVTFYTSLANHETLERAYLNAVDAIKLRYIEYGAIEPAVTHYRGLGEETGVGSSANPWELVVTDSAILNWKITRSNRIMRQLKAGSRTYHQNLRNGRYKYLKIADMLLARVQSPFIETQATLANCATAGDLYDVLKKTWEQEVPHVVLLAEGGMGKTVSLIHLWEMLLKNPGEPVPLFIALNEYNNVLSETDKEKFLLKKVAKNYLGRERLTGQEENDLWDVLKTPAQAGDAYRPSFILFLDGFNELAGDKTKLLLELREWVDMAAGVQIVVTSRYDMRNFSWTAAFSLVTVLPLSENAINNYFQYLVKELGISLSLPTNGQVRKMLANPFMLTLFTASSAQVANHQNDPRYDFKKHNHSYGELMWNFMEAQVVKYAEAADCEPDKAAYYHFLLRHMLPYIGHEMEKREQFFLPAGDLKSIIADAAAYCYRQEFMETFTRYEACLDRFGLDLDKNDYPKWVRKVTGIISTLSESMLMLVEEDNAYRFLHQHFRDFFSAVHILNDTRLSLRLKALPQLFQQRALPAAVRRAMGEIEGEQYNKPAFDGRRQQWGLGEARNSLLIQTIDACRQSGASTDTGFLVWNILTTWQELRGELTGEQLNELDLRNYNFAGLPNFRQIKGHYLCADFRRSLFSRESFLLKGHSEAINFIDINKAGTRFLTASDDGQVKEWDLNRGVCLVTLKYRNRVLVARYSENESVALIGGDDGRFLLTKLDNLQLDKEHRSVYGHPVKHMAVQDKMIAVASYDGDIYIHKEEENGYLTLIAQIKNLLNKVVSLEWNKRTGRLLFIKETEIIELFWNNDGMVKCKYVPDEGQFILAATYTAEYDEIIAITNDDWILTWKTGEDGRTYRYTHNIKCQVGMRPGITFDQARQKCVFASEWSNQTLFHTLIEVDLCTGNPLNEFRIERDIISSYTYLKGGKELLVGAYVGNIYQFSTETGELLNTFQRTPGRLCFSMFGIDDKILCYSGIGVLHEFTLQQPTCVNQVKMHDFEITGAFYDSNGNLISVAGNGEVKYWETDTGRVEWITTLNEAPFQVLLVGDHLLALRYYTAGIQRYWIDLLNIRTREVTTVFSNSCHNLTMLCAGTHGFFIQENNDYRSRLYYCPVDSKKLLLIDTINDARLELFTGDCNAEGTMVIIGLSSGNILIYQQVEDDWWTQTNTFRGSIRSFSLTLIRQEQQVGVIWRDGRFEVFDIATETCVEHGELPAFLEPNDYIRSGRFREDGSAIVYEIGQEYRIYDRVTQQHHVLSMSLGPLVANCPFQGAKGLDMDTTAILKRYGALF